MKKILNEAGPAGLVTVILAVVILGLIFSPTIRQFLPYGSSITAAAAAAATEEDREAAACLTVLQAAGGPMPPDPHAAAASALAWCEVHLAAAEQPREVVTVTASLGEGFTSALAEAENGAEIAPLPAPPPPRPAATAEEEATTVPPLPRVRPADLPRVTTPAAPPQAARPSPPRTASPPPATNRDLTACRYDLQAVRIPPEQSGPCKRLMEAQRRAGTATVYTVVKPAGPLAGLLGRQGQVVYHGQLPNLDE